jgi:hypothetical protein
MDGLIQLLQNNPLIILVMFIISVLSGIITIILGWKKFYNDVLSKRITLPVYAYLIIFFFVALVIIFWPTIEKRPKRLRTIEGESFGVQRVYLDGKRFVNCTFEGTEIVFKGETGFELKNNTLTGIKIALDGPAATTALFFKEMYTDPPFRPFIDNLFEQIKSGAIKKAIPPSRAAGD